jgi:putative lipoprotein
MFPYKPFNISYRETGQKAACHNFYFLWMHGSGIRIPIPFITLGYMGVIPKGDISSYSSNSGNKDFDFKAQLTTEYDKEGRPTRIEETVTTLNKNNKQESGKYVTEYIW